MAGPNCMSFGHIQDASFWVLPRRGSPSHACQALVDPCSVRLSGPMQACNSMAPNHKVEHHLSHQEPATIEAFGLFSMHYVYYAYYKLRCLAFFYLFLIFARAHGTFCQMYAWYPANMSLRCRCPSLHVVLLHVAFCFFLLPRIILVLARRMITKWL